MSVNQRIKIFQESVSNQRSFSKKTGINEKTISALYKGLSKPSFGVIESILLAFPELNERWLFFGEGKMLKDSINVEHSKEEELSEVGEDAAVYGTKTPIYTEGVLESIQRRLSDLEIIVEKLNTEK